MDWKCKIKYLFSFVYFQETYVAEDLFILFTTIKNLCNKTEKIRIIVTDPRFNVFPALAIFVPSVQYEIKYLNTTSLL